MTRKILVGAVGEACRRTGFDFSTGFEYRLSSQVERLPAAWLETPKLQKTEGRNEGIKHYIIKINLLDRCTDHSPAAKEEAWNSLEEHAAELLNIVSEHEAVQTLLDVELTPAEFSLTTGGELSLCVTCTALMPF